MHKAKLTNLMPRRFRAKFDAAFVALKSGGEVRDLEGELRRKDAPVLPVLLSATALIDSNGQFLDSRASGYCAATHRFVFDYHEGEVYWCTAEVGWVTGHSYTVYGPLPNGAATLMFEGVPNHPDAARFWRVCDKHAVNVLYTAPTAIRALMREGDAPVKKTSRRSLRVLGSVGEPINPEAWLWYYEVVGEKRCPVVDTWWQTETGGILISPLPGATPLKPGSAAWPFFGVQPQLVDDDGKVIEGAGSGNVRLVDSWPGQMRGVYGDPQRMQQQYFSRFEGKYFSGEAATATPTAITGSAVPAEDALGKDHAPHPAQDRRRRLRASGRRVDARRPASGQGPGRSSREPLINPTRH